MFFYSDSDIILMLLMKTVNKSHSKSKVLENKRKVIKSCLVNKSNWIEVHLNYFQSIQFDNALKLMQMYLIIKINYL